MSLGSFTEDILLEGGLAHLARLDATTPFESDFVIKNPSSMPRDEQFGVQFFPGVKKWQYTDMFEPSAPCLDVVKDQLHEYLNGPNMQAGNIVYNKNHETDPGTLGVYEICRTTSLVNPRIHQKNTSLGDSSVSGTLMLQRNKFTPDHMRATYDEDYRNNSISISKRMREFKESIYSSNKEFTVLKSHGAITSFEYLRNSVHPLTQEPNDLADLVYSFTCANTELEDLPADWDPVGNLMKQYQPRGLYVSDMCDTLGLPVDSVSHYDVILITRGNPTSTGNRACATVKGHMPCNDYTMRIPTGSFLNLEDENTKSGGGVFFHDGQPLNIFMVGVMNQRCQLDLYVTTTHLTARGVNTMLRQRFSDAFYVYLNLLEKHTREYYNIPPPINWVRPITPAFSGVYRIGRTPRNQYSIITLDSTDHNYLRIPCILEPGPAWITTY